MTIIDAARRRSYTCSARQNPSKNAHITHRSQRGPKTQGLETQTTLHAAWSLPNNRFVVESGSGVVICLAPMLGAAIVAIPYSVECFLLRNAPFASKLHANNCELKRIGLWCAENVDQMCVSSHGARNRFFWTHFGHRSPYDSSKEKESDVQHTGKKGAHKSQGPGLADDRECIARCGSGWSLVSHRNANFDG